MNVPPPDSPIWKLLRTVVIGVLFIVGAHVWYRNGWSPDDFKSLAMLLAGSLGFDVLKQTITKPKNEGE